MADFEPIISFVLFVSAAFMLIAVWRAAHQNRLLGVCLLVMAITTVIGVGLHLDRLREGSMIAVLNVLTAVMWFAAGVVCLRNRTL